MKNTEDSKKNHQYRGSIPFVTYDGVVVYDHNSIEAMVELVYLRFCVRDRAVGTLWIPRNVMLVCTCMYIRTHFLNT